jgi:hypothetical protein
MRKEAHSHKALKHTAFMTGSILAKYGNEIDATYLAVSAREAR